MSLKKIETNVEHSIVTMSKKTRERVVPRANVRRTSASKDGGMREQWRNAFTRMKEERAYTTITGGLLTLLALFLLVALFSYLKYGAADQSVLMNSSGLSPEEFSKKIDGKTGVIGYQLMNQMVNEWVGLGVVFIIYLIGAIGVGLLKIPYLRVKYFKTIFFSVIATFWSSLTLASLFKPFVGRFFFYPGGVLGHQMFRQLKIMIGWPGVILVIILGLLLILFIFFEPIRHRYLHWTSRKWVQTESPEEEIIKEKKEKNWGLGKYFSRKKKSKKDATPSEPVPATPEMPIVNETPAGPPVKPVVGGTTELSSMPRAKTSVPSKEGDLKIDVVDLRNATDEVSVSEAEARAKQLVSEQGLYDPKLELSRYEMPSIELLRKYDQENEEIDQREIDENKQLIISTLESFRIEITSITATVGPAITLYEVVPAAGIHISKIKSLEDNISMSLSAMGIRIIAPIPGKGTIGLEVPNKNPRIVSMRSVIASKAFQESKAQLPVAFGRTITNDVFIFDLAKTPHLLIAGATGQGKSVGLNAVITSLLYKKHPTELKFVMIDPKMVEFSMYGKIEKHYMAKLVEEDQVIITDPKRVLDTLNSLCEEMEQRYTLLAKANMRNIKEYNERFKKRLLNPEHGHKFLPYIVLIIDEYGDLMLTGGKEIEMPITRLAQKARAVGIHAIIATQRPMASIITGAIKANFPGRIAFKVMSSTDSRIILDTSGANRLIGRGDSLYSQGNDLTRVQCAFVDTPEVNALVDFISSQRGFSEAYELPKPVPEGPSGDGFVGDGAKDPSQRDELFNEVAYRLVVEQRASTSFIQQIFAIGYNRAARLMVQLEHAGIVGPQDGQKPREVLVQNEDQLRRVLNPDE